MVARIISVLSTLNQAGIRARRGTLNEKAIAPDSPVAVVYPEKSAPDFLTLAVEVFGTHAVQCEDVAYEALGVLHSLRGDCTVEKCQYSGKTGLFSVKILASWPAALAQEVYLDDVLLPHLTDFRAEATSEAYLLEDGQCTQSSWVWTLTLEELIPEGKIPDAQWAEVHTVKVVSAGGTEVYTPCCWTSVRRDCDSRGILQIRTMKCWKRTIE